MSKLLCKRFLVLALCFSLPHIAAANSFSKPETLTLFVRGAAENMEFVRGEVARLMEPVGFAVEWKDMSERRAGLDYAHLATVDFRGNCAVSTARSTPVSGAPIRSLASTAVVDGRVLPFSTVHCDALRTMMSDVLTSAKRELRTQIFARAAARVLAHELFHMLAQTKTHGSVGIAKACFGLADLTSERFEFDAVTLAQMRPAQEIMATPFDAEEDIGR